MNTYIPDPKIFQVEEFFSPTTIHKQLNDGKPLSLLWRLMDSRVTWTAVQLRNLFGTMICNDYLWGGKNINRGYRNVIEIIDWEHYKQTGEIITFFSSLTSQHCHGRGLDSTFKKILAHDVRDYIIKNNRRSEFKFITAIEKEVPWFHFDVRNFKMQDERFFIF